MDKYNISDDIIISFPYHAILGDPEVTANIYCKSRNLPNTDTQNYGTDLRQLLGHPVQFGPVRPCPYEAAEMLQMRWVENPGNLPPH